MAAMSRADEIRALIHEEIRENKRPRSVTIACIPGIGISLAAAIFGFLILMLTFAVSDASMLPEFGQQLVGYSLNGSPVVLGMLLIAVGTAGMVGYALVMKMKKAGLVFAAVAGVCEIIILILLFSFELITIATLAGNAVILVYLLTKRHIFY